MKAGEPMDVEWKKLNILVAIDEVPDPLWNKLGSLAQFRFVREGEGAYRMLSSEQFDAMFLDLNLTGMDSLELLRRSRMENLCPVVILTSAVPSFSYAQQGILYGVSAYLLRPLDEQEVKASIRKLQAAADAYDPLLREAAREVVEHLRDDSAPGDFLRLGEELTAACGTVMERNIRWRDYYKALTHLAFQRYPWLKLYHHPAQYASLDCVQESDDQMVVNFCLRKVRSLSDDLVELFPKFCNQNLEEILIFLLQSIDENIQQKDVAERYFITNSTLSTRFQRNLGISYREYMTTLKLRRGQYLLQYTDIRPEELPARLGYKDRKHFCELFYQRTGQTLQEYGRKHWDGYNI